MFKYINVGGKYKYKLVAPYQYIVGYDLGYNITSNPYVQLIDGGGIIAFKEGYAWDGSTGGIDSPETRRASLVHDGLCQLIAEDELSLRDRKQADILFRQICIADGVSSFRAWYSYLAIRLYVKITYGREF